MVSTVQFLVDEPSCRPLHQNVAAAAMGLLVAMDSTISDILGASHRSASHGDSFRPTSSSSTNTHATAPSAAETPVVSWRYTLSSEPNARTPFTLFSMPHFEAFAALVAGDAGIDNSTYSGRNISSCSNQSKSSTSIPAHSWRNLTQDVLKALQFVSKSSDAVPNDSSESEYQISCLIVAFCRVPSDTSDGIEALRTLESNLKRRGVKLLVVDTSAEANFATSSSHSSFNSNNSSSDNTSCSINVGSGGSIKEDMATVCTALGISIVSLEKLVHALGILPPKLCMPILCPLAFPGVLPSFEPEQYVTTTASTTHVFLPKPPSPVEDTVEKEREEASSHQHENTSLHDSSSVIESVGLVGNKRQHPNALAKKKREDEGIVQEVDELMWLGSVNLIPWMRSSHNSPCGCPPPSAFVIHARVHASASFSTNNEELSGKKMLQSSPVNESDISAGSLCSFEPFILTTTPNATSPLGDNSDTSGRRSSADTWVGNDQTSKPETSEIGSMAKNSRARSDDKTRANLRVYDLVCAKGHPMNQAQVQFSAACDGCAQKVRRGKKIWSCRSCNYDLCEACAAAMDKRSSHEGLEAFLRDLSDANEVALVSWPRCHSKGCCGVAVGDDYGRPPCNNHIDDDNDDTENQCILRSGLVFGIMTPLPIPGCALLKQLNRSQAAVTAGGRKSSEMAAANATSPFNDNPTSLGSNSGARTDANSDTLVFLPFLLAEPPPVNNVSADFNMGCDEESEEDLAALAEELNQRIHEQQEQVRSGLLSSARKEKQSQAAGSADGANGVKSLGFVNSVQASRDPAIMGAIPSTLDKTTALATSTERIAAADTTSAEAITVSCEPSPQEVKTIESLGRWFTTLCGAFEQNGRPLLDDVIFQALPEAMAAAQKLTGKDVSAEQDERKPSASLSDVLTTHLIVKCAQLSAQAAAEAKRQKKKARKAHAKDTKGKRTKKRKIEASKKDSSKYNSGKDSSRVNDGGDGDGDLVPEELAKRTSLEVGIARSEANEICAEQKDEISAIESAQMLANRVLLRQHCLALMLLLLLPTYNSRKDSKEVISNASAHDLTEGLRIVREFVPRLAILMADPSRRQRPSLASNFGTKSGSSSSNDGSVGSGIIENSDEAEQMVDGVPYSSAESMLQRLYAIPDVRSASPELFDAVADELGIDFSSSDDDNVDSDNPTKDASDVFMDGHTAANTAAPPSRLNDVWKMPPDEFAETSTSTAGASFTANFTSAVAVASGTASASANTSGPSISGVTPAAAARVAPSAPAPSTLKAAAGAAKAKQHGKTHLNRLRTTQTTKTVVQPVRTSSNATGNSSRCSTTGSSITSSSSSQGRRRGEESSILENASSTKKRKEDTSKQPSNGRFESSSSASIPSAPFSPSSSSSSSHATLSQHILVGETPTKKPSQKANRERELEMSMWDSP